MDNLIVLASCGDGTCCCLSPRSAVVFISVISLSASLIETFLNDNGRLCCEVVQQVESLRGTLVTLFQMANILLLLGSIIENALLLQIYLWYALGFIVLGFVVAIVDFVFRFNDHACWSLVSLITEVAFLFVSFRCLPLVDSYRRRLEATRPQIQFSIP